MKPKLDKKFSDTPTQGSTHSAPGDGGRQADRNPQREPRAEEERQDDEDQEKTDLAVRSRRSMRSCRSVARFSHTVSSTPAGSFERRVSR